MIRKEDLIETLDGISPAWLGGFFDGEGGVCIYVRRTDPPQISVTLTQSEPTLLMLIALKLGLVNCGPYENHSNINVKRSYKLNMSGNGTRVFLETIKDHVVLKKRHVKLALEFVEVLNKQGHFLTPEAKEKRLEIFEKMKLLNSEVVSEVFEELQEKITSLSQGDKKP
jgi:hypothetical protein